MSLGIYYRDGYGPLIGGFIWDLELTDLTTPANSRFYPLIQYRHTQRIQVDVEFVKRFARIISTTSDFYYWRLVSGQLSIDSILKVAAFT